MRARNVATIAVLLAACSSQKGPRPVFERFPIETTPGTDAYPDVPGVILLDKGALLFTADPDRKAPIARLRRYVRLKVLRESGKALGRIKIPFDTNTVISDLVAQALLPSGDALSLSGSDIADVVLEGGQKAKAFAFPDLPPGSFIEYTYDLYFGDLRFIPPWRFSGDLPTQLSEYAAIVPPAFQVDFRTLEGGRPVERPPERFETEEGTRLFWRVIDQPAVFNEPDMPSPELIAPQTQVMFVSADVAGLRTLGFKTWDDVKTWIDKEHAPGWSILDEPQIAEARRIAGTGTAEEQALHMHAVVARDLGWEPGPRAPLWRARTPSAGTVLREKRGNASSRGLLLVALLRAVGLNAFPALAANRDQSFLFPDLPNVRGVDGIVAVLPRGPNTLVLDPSELTASVEVPSPRLQGTRLILLKDDAFELYEVPFSAAASSKTSVRYELRADKEGRVAGTVEAKLTGAEAGALRAALLAADPTRYSEIAGAFLASRGGVLPLESASLGDIEALTKPLSLKGLIPATAVFDPAAGDRVTVALGKLVSAGPGGIRERRRWSLLLPAPRNVEMVVVMALPEDHEPDVLPPAFLDACALGKIEVAVRADKGPRITVKATSQLAVSEIKPDDYPTYFKHLSAAGRASQIRITLKRPAPRTYEY